MTTATIDENKLNEFVGQRRRRHRGRDQRGAGAHRRRAGPLQGDGRAGPITPAELARADRDHRALRARVADQPGGGRLRHLRSRDRTLHAAARAGAGAGRRGEPGVPPRRVPGHRRGRCEAEPRIAAGVPHRRGPRLGRARPRACSTAPSASSARATSATWSAQWIPALDGVEAKLERGRHASPTSAAATARRRSSWRRPSRIRSSSASTTTPPRSRRRGGGAREAGVADRVRFEVAAARTTRGNGYDLVACFDCLHDMGDPGRARRGTSARRWRRTARWLIVEPFASDRVEDNLNPVGRVFYGASTVVCVPCSLARARAGAGRAGGRGAPAQRGRRRGRLLQPAPRDRDAVQPGARRPSLAAL